MGEQGIRRVKMIAWHKTDKSKYIGRNLTEPDNILCTVATMTWREGGRENGTKKQIYSPETIALTTNL
jgi:hypothetical protein